MIQKAEERIFTEKNRVGKEMLSIALEGSSFEARRLRAD